MHVFCINYPYFALILPPNILYFIYPLTLAEFLTATDESEALELLNTTPTPDYAHDQLLQLLHRYTLLGGMPEIIQHYSKQLDLVTLNSIYRKLLVSYNDDVSKYVRTWCRVLTKDIKLIAKILLYFVKT